MSNYKTLNLKNILLMLIVSFCFSGSNAFASDNVLQAIQVDGVKDSYNVILKSDDVAEVKKTVQAPNKMILNLNGIRASKTINTIYNNTSNVDSVVVEPTGDDSVKILIQADNASNAEVHFDTLKTPLGVLDKTTKADKPADELVLNGPVKSYKPVYDENQNDEDQISLSGFSGSAARHLKKIFKDGNLSIMLTFGLFSILVITGIKTIKGNDNDIKVGLSQSLKEREIDMYKGAAGLELGINSHPGVRAEISNSVSGQGQAPQTINGGYGVRAYQQNTRNPYLSSEMQKPKMTATPAPTANIQQQIARNMTQKPVIQNNNSAMQGTMQNTMQNTIPKATSSTAARPKSTNIDSMKFLESMTKIYEKNGRSDLAQGLKTNMKKAKMNLK